MTELTKDEMQKILLGHITHLEAGIKDGNFFRAESEAQLIADLAKLWRVEASGE